MSDERPEFEHLSNDMRARVDALRAARGVIAASSPLTKAGADPIDVVAVARFIVTGKDPWDRPEILRNMAGEEVARTDPEG